MIGALFATIAVLTNSVSFSVKATGLEVAAPVEFIFAGPESDRDYESLFLTDDSLEELVAAFRKAGFPFGRPIDVKRGILWPTGARLTLKPSLDEFLVDKERKQLLPLVLQGGNGDGTNMPRSVFSTYTAAQSLIAFDDALDQSQTYGEFHARKPLKQGDSQTFTALWDGASVANDMTPDFPSDKTVAEAIKVAQGLARIDSREVKINGFRDGQFFYRAFLPLEKWRDRRERLVQPVEVDLHGTNAVFTVIDEDWSVEGMDPALTPRTVTQSEAVARKTDTCFIYASGDEKLARLYEIKKAFPKSFVNWYIFRN